MTMLIEQGSWERYDRPGYPDDVTTGGMGPCTGVLVFNNATGVTFGAHLPMPHSHHAEELDAMLAAAVAEFGDTPDVKICVSGCCDGLAFEEYDPPSIRRYVETRVRSFFPSHKDLGGSWPAPGAVSAVLTLDPETGEFYLSCE